ncbi:MAG: FTR1 family protein [Candidatus Levybacteria bacterium]|nr:FTR1 family protein [Candidatus Levybacteria bacterium]
MFATGLITFRETLEVALVVGILLTFFTKTRQTQFNKYVWYGVTGGVGLSILLAFVLYITFGGFEGKTEEIFEGILMFATAGFLTWMILWVHRQKGIATKLQKKAQYHIQKGYPLGIVFLTITSVIREGVETVFYLRAISVLAGGSQLAGALLGMGFAIGLGYAIFRYSLKINLAKLLQISGAILLLFAAGLVAHGVHEFQEAGVLPIFSFDPLLNISHILDNGSFLGSILRTLFGYTAKPTILELLSYGSYVFLIFFIENITDRMLLAKKATVINNR